MKLLDIYANMKDDLTFVEDRLAQEVRSNQANITDASLHLLQAGGKRIRPLFVLLSGKFGSYDLDVLGRVAVALELIHMATLVHDDVIDCSMIRRGRPTVKAKWNNQMAMYTGDYIFAKALSLLGNLNAPELHRLLSNAIVSVCEGEIEQIRDFFRLDQSIRTYLRRIKRKTALLISVSCASGALSAGCSDDIVKTLAKYGYYAGMAFQITDDILDMTADPETLGKPTGSDLLQGNITLPTLYALANPVYATQLHDLIDPSVSASDVELAISLVKQSGGIEWASQISQRYLEKAIQILDLLPDADPKRTLTEMALFINRRQH